MAYADLMTGKIYGAKKGTLKYFHEEGHLRYEDNESGRRIRMLQEVSSDSVVTSLVIFIIYPCFVFKLLVLIIFLLKIYSNMKEEWDCWKYAKYKLNEVNNVKRSKRRFKKK